MTVEGGRSPLIDSASTSKEEASDARSLYVISRIRSLHSNMGKVAAIRRSITFHQSASEKLMEYDGPGLESFKHRLNYIQTSLSDHAEDLQGLKDGFQNLIDLVNDHHLPANARPVLRRSRSLTFKVSGQTSHWPCSQYWRLSSFH